MKQIIIAAAYYVPHKIAFCFNCLDIRCHLNSVEMNAHSDTDRLLRCQTEAREELLRSATFTLQCECLKLRGSMELWMITTVKVLGYLNYCYNKHKCVSVWWWLAGQFDGWSQNSMYSFVQASRTDTLSSIAARYRTTTSELTKINRLMSSLIFPGQVCKLSSSHECQRGPYFGDASSPHLTSLPPLFSCPLSYSFLYPLSANRPRLLHPHSGTPLNLRSSGGILSYSRV